MKIHQQSEVLIANGKKGKKFWQTRILTDGENFYHQSRTWHETKSGVSKEMESAPYLVEAKNVGRSNATTPQMQAELEFDSIVEKQKDKGYLAEGEERDSFVKPMLAQKYEDRKHHLQWPVYVQPKLNGMRMLTDGEIAWSRGGKQIIPDVVKHILPGVKLKFIVDGELILPGNVLLQETMKAAKKWRPGVSDKLQYHVYDIVADMPFRGRKDVLKHLPICKNKNVIVVETKECADEAEVKKMHKQFTKAKFEGTIIRDNSAGYEVDRRSNQLQKFKDFVDGEFKIVAVNEGGGSFKGCAIFRCVTEGGVEFDCTPEGNTAHRKALYKTRKEHLGKWLTIRYQELSKDGVPLFPVGVEVREKGEF